MPELPNWVYDLVNEIDRWEDEGHMLPSFGIEETKAMCHKKWWNLVPADVQQAARAIAAYKENQAEAATDGG